MGKSEYFPIGQVAKLFQISVGTLRHYERAGLLAPEYIDPHSGYRYYSFRQFEVLNTIRYLRVLDMPLDEIADFLKNRDTDVMEAKLLEQKRVISQKRRELEMIEGKIDNRLRQLRSARLEALDHIQLQPLPPCRMVSMQASLSPQDHAALELPIRKLTQGQKTPLAFLGKVGLGISPAHLAAGAFGRYDLVFLLLDEEDVYQGAVEHLPAGQCVSVRFRGSHREAPVYYERLCAYCRENGLKISGFSREITLVDEGMAQDTDKFVTEIRLPVVPVS